MLSYGMVWYGMIWYDMVWYDLVWMRQARLFLIPHRLINLSYMLNEFGM